MEDSNHRLHSIALSESEESKHIPDDKPIKKPKTCCSKTNKSNESKESNETNEMNVYKIYDENDCLLCKYLDWCSWLSNINCKKSSCCERNIVCFMCCCSITFE